MRIRYPNGDLVSVEFNEIASPVDAKQRYPDASVEHWSIEFPVTVVEVTNVVAGTGLEFNAKETKVGSNVMRNCFMSHCGAGLAVG